ncbi:hypothetical protein OB919_19080 [Halobacteria archaeon AArc-curdl1]|uniref:Uncharacterized protein n=1 Tax=Natronosalvus hydrolyticus TaxID=2979988 RepID=A0AAP2ZBE8_9EURY|nr:hypothetical protein [Halobacteria archaeon AArc-curdl1]
MEPIHLSRTEQDESTHKDPRTSPADQATEEGTPSSSSALERRSVLKGLAVCAVPFVAGQSVAGESGSEDATYGNGGYGAGAYGGVDSDAPVTDDPDPLERTILIDGIGTTGESQYEIEIDGTVEPSTYKGASIDETTVIEDGHVSGSVTGWRDAFRFDGEIESLTVDGSARVYVDDDRVDPVEYGGESVSVLTFVGNGVPSRYRVTVDGDLEVLEGDAELTASGDTATGSIETDVHRLQFTGDLLECTFEEGGTQVYLDDERIDPEEYDGTEQLPHLIVFDGTGADDSSHYAFSVSEGVEQSTDDGATKTTGSVIDGNEVRGSVEAGEKTAYRFDGEIETFSLVGTADVDVSYDRW